MNDPKIRRASGKYFPPAEPLQFEPFPRENELFRKTEVAILVWPSRHLFNRHSAVTKLTVASLSIEISRKMPRHTSIQSA